MDIDATQEITELREKGFNVKESVPGNEKKLTPEECDLLIYHYRNSPEATERLKEIADILSAFRRPVPLIIYTYQSGLQRIPEAQMEALADFKNYIISNMPITLKSHFNSLIRD